MSDLQQFKNPKYFRRIEVGELTPVGKFKSNDKSFKLIGLSMFFYLTGNLLGSETFAVEIYSTKKADNLLWTSDDFTIPATIKSTDKWMGWIKFSFNKKPVSNAFWYYIFLRQKTFAPAPGTELYLGYDFNEPQYNNGENKFYNHPLAFKIEGEVEYVI